MHSLNLFWFWTNNNHTATRISKRVKVGSNMNMNARPTASQPTDSIIKTILIVRITEIILVYFSYKYTYL